MKTFYEIYKQNKLSARYALTTESGNEMAFCDAIEEYLQQFIKGGDTDVGKSI